MHGEARDGREKLLRLDQAALERVDGASQPASQRGEFLYLEWTLSFPSSAAGGDVGIGGENVTDLSLLMDHY